MLYAEGIQNLTSLVKNQRSKRRTEAQIKERKRVKRYLTVGDLIV